MPSFYADQLTERENYKLLTGSIVPRPVAFVTTLSSTGVVNGAPFSYFNIVSSNPPMISLAIQRRQGESKDTAQNITNNKQFVVHIVDEHNVSEINKTAATLPIEQSELEHTSLTLVESELIAVPAIAEANIRFECRLVEVMQLPKENPNVDFIIGEVLRYEVADEVFDHKNNYIIANKLKPVSRLAGNHYATLGEQFELERPQ